MNDVPDTELFSAYLDGELTADEQVRAEQLLAASPGARQLLEELRALGSTLQGLPQEKLDEDISARVLQIAERRMLLPDDSGGKPSAGRAAEALKESETDPIGWLGQIQQGKPAWREISWRGMFSKRALIWSGVVVATAIIISFNSPPPKANRDLARRDGEPAAGAAAASTEKRSASSKSDGSWDVPAGQPRTSQTDAMPAKDAGRLAADDKGKAADYSGSTTVAGATFRKAADAKTRELKTEADRDHLQERDRRTEESVVADAYHGPGGKKFADKLANKESESSGRRMNKAGSSAPAKDLVDEKAMAEKAGENHLRAYEKPSEAIALSDSGGAPAAGAAPGKPGSGPMPEKPAAGPTADQKGGLDYKLALRDRTGFGVKSAEKKSGGDEPVGEAAKKAPANEDLGQGGGGGAQVKAKAVQSQEEKEEKAAQTFNWSAASKPAPASSPLPPASAPSTPSQLETLKSDAAKPAAEPTPPAIAMSQPPAAPQSLGAPSPANGKRGPAKGGTEYADTAYPSKGNETSQVITGAIVATASNAATASGGLSIGGATTPANWKDVQTSPARFAGQGAAAGTVFRLDVTSLAVENKVFENLLHDGLGSDQNFANMAQNGPADNLNLRAGQPKQGGRGGAQDLNRQQNLAANNSGLGGGMGGGTFQLAPSGSTALGALNPQQVVSPATPPAAKNDASRARQSEANSQATVDPQHGVVAQAPVEQRDLITKGLKQQVTKAVVYEFDASPEQLAMIFKQIGERSDSFSATEIKPAVGALLGNNSLGENNYNYYNNYSGGLRGEGTTDNRQGGQQQYKFDAGAAKVAPEGAAQPQTAPAPASYGARQTALPAAGAAKQHVIFVLNVVDRLPPAAARASHVPAPAAPAPAKH